MLACNIILRPIEYSSTSSVEHAIHARVDDHRWISVTLARLIEVAFPP